jgi:hypothetical protein
MSIFLLLLSSSTATGHNPPFPFLFEACLHSPNRMAQGRHRFHPFIMLQDEHEDGA